MNRLWRRIRDEWEHPEERELVFPTILGLMVVLMLGAPTLRWFLHQAGGSGADPSFLEQTIETSFSVSTAVILMASIWAYSSSKRRTDLSLLLFVLAVGLSLVNLFFLPGHGILELSYLPQIPLLFLACYTLLHYLVRARRVSAGTLSGAVLCYLLLALLFTQLYLCLWWIQPDSFRGIASWPPDSPLSMLDFAIQSDLMNHLQYLSMTTITTLGYGDITPTNAVGRSLVTAEAAFGQIYIGIVIAKLVSLYMREPGATREDREE